MDPITALILAGVLASVSFHTLGTAISDVFSSKNGDEPPSLTKWRENQQRKAERGEKRASAEPSPWRRRWDNAVEYRNAKAAQKHTARMEDVRDNGRENVDRHKQRLARRRARREAINTTVAGWGASSWEMAKRAAESARDNAKDRQGRETSRGDKPEEPVSHEAEDAVEDGTVVPFQRPGESNEAQGQDEPSSSESTTEGVPHRQQGGATGQTPVNPETKFVTDPDDPGRGVSIAELQRRRAAQERQAEREHQERMARIQQGGDDELDTASNTDLGEDSEMSSNTTTTEITDLDTATSFAQETARYADRVAATLADILGQLDTAAKGLDAESGQYEQGQASLEEEGFGSKVTGRFASSAEALHTAAEALRQAVTAVSDASEQVSTAGGEMRGAAKTFGDQQAVAEQIGAAAQDAGVSKRTGFYASV